MSELNNLTEQSDLASASSSGIARRRMILASLGKGATVTAAVAVPMNSLAAFGTLSITADGRRCTLSGNMSKPHSTETTTALCEGWSPSYYSQTANWPPSTNLDGSYTIPSNGAFFARTFTQNTSFIGLFGTGSDESLINILTNSPSSNEATWIAAVLNGTPGSPAEAANFPYTAAEVLGLYSGSKSAEALAFFKGFMQTRS